MSQPRTHFEQIPLKIVKKIAKEEIELEETTEPAPGIKEGNEKRDRLPAGSPRSVSSDS
jgi:hypothetical protein